MTKDFGLRLGSGEANKMTFRIGAVSYLNTKPLIHGLDRALPGAELTLDLPSRLATS